MAAHQAPPSLGFSRQEHWSGVPFPSPMHESEKSKWSHSVSVWRFVTPWTTAYQAPPSMGFSRQEYWSGLHCLLQEVIYGVRIQDSGNPWGEGGNTIGRIWREPLGVLAMCYFCIYMVATGVVTLIIYLLTCTLFFCTPYSNRKVKRAWQFNQLSVYSDTVCNLCRQVSTRYAGPECPNCGKSTRH